MWLGQGCSRVNSESRLNIGGDSVPALSTDRHPIAPVGSSLVGGTRDHWEMGTIIVPIDGTEHHPHYTLAQPNYSSSGRANGAYPTALSALDLGSPAGPQVWEAAAAPFHCAADIALFLPRAFVTSPNRVVISPSEPFQRYREHAVDAAPSLAPEPAMITPPAE